MQRLLPPQLFTNSFESNSVYNDWTTLSDKWEGILKDLGDVAQQWIGNRAALRGVVRKGLTTDDKAKIDRLKRIFVEQLKE